MHNQAVFFDLDDTIYAQLKPFEEAYDKTFGDRKYDISIDRLFYSSRVYSDVVFEASQSGEMSMRDMYIYRMTHAMQDFNIRITSEEALTFQNNYKEAQNKIEMSDAMIKILETAHEYHRIGIITNGPSKHQWNKIEQLGVLNYIKREMIFISEEIGYTKPDPEIYHFVRDRFGMQSNNMWYIGDTYRNDIEGAHEAGWNTVWFNRKGLSIPVKPVHDVIVNTEEELLDWLYKNV